MVSSLQSTRDWIKTKWPYSDRRPSRGNFSFRCSREIFYEVVVDSIVLERLVMVSVLVWTVAACVLGSRRFIAKRHQIIRTVGNVCNKTSSIIPALGSHRSTAVRHCKPRTLCWMIGMDLPGERCWFFMPLVG